MNKARLYTGTGPRDFVDVPMAGPTIGPQIVSRSSAASEYTFGTLLPNPDPVLRKMGKDIAVYRDLRVDPKVGACIYNRQAGTLSQEWDIDRGRARSRVASFVSDVLRNLPMHSIMSEMLEAPLFGYKPIEVCWGYDGRYVVPTQINGLPQDWFAYDTNNHLRYLVKGVPEGLDTTLPEYRYKFLCARHRPSYANPRGEPVMAMCFWYVAFKKGGMRFWVTMTEKYGMPFLVAKYRQGADDAEKAALLESLEKMVQDACGIIPDGNSVEALEFSTSGNAAALYERLLRYCDEQISMAILGHTGSSASTPGKLGGDDASLAVRKDIVDADKAIVSEAINQLVRWLVEINFGPGADAPVFGIYEEEDVDKAQAERDKTLYDMGARFKEPYMMRTYGFEEGDISMADAPAQTLPGAPGVPTSFAAPSGDTAQGEVDALAEGLPPELLQEQVEKLLAPVVAMIEQAGSLEDIQTKIAELFPTLDSSGIQKTLEKAILLADTWGRLQANPGHKE